jgi:hypothetical protein
MTFPLTVSAFQCLAIASVANAGVVTFDDLPEPTYTYSYARGAPLAAAQGFRFTSTNNNFVSPVYRDIWGYYEPTVPWTGAPGQPAVANGIVSRRRAATSWNYSEWHPSEYFIARADGGNWTFGGAWFTAVWAGISNQLRVVGYSGTEVVFDVQSAITIDGPTFVAPTVAGLAIDRIVITNQYTSQFGVALGGHFTMDDLHYELIPGTGGCPADLNADRVVNADDLSLLLAAWGPCAACAQDLNHDASVDGSDLGILLGAWGPCPD